MKKGFSILTVIIFVGSLSLGYLLVSKFYFSQKATQEIVSGSIGIASESAKRGLDVNKNNIDKITIVFLTTNSRVTFRWIETAKVMFSAYLMGK
mgnify:CR=1 FL=1